jgi:4-amino-4-deoxy-L-arabinose transferase-like glycosyltransferase
VVNNGRWYSQYPPGYPALLSIGYIFKAPWIINTIFAALTIILIFFLGIELFDKKVAFLASLLASLSYWFLILSSTMLSHTTHLFFCTLFLLFYIRFIKHPCLPNSLIAGFGFLMAFLIRPYESVLFAVPPAIYLLFLMFKEPKKYLNAVLPMAFMAALSLAILLAYNYGTTGNPLKMGYIERYGPEHGIGFGRKGYTDTPHTFFRGADLTAKHFYQLHLHLFGWPISSLLGILLYLFYFVKDYRVRESRNLEALLLFIILSTIVGLLFYWGLSPILGARMYFQLFSVLVVLTAAGIVEFIRASRLSRILKLNRRSIQIALLVIFTVYAYAVRLPSFARQSPEAYIVDLIYPDFLSFNKRFDETIKALHIDNAVVLLRPLYMANKYFPDTGWTAGFNHDDPELNQSLIFGLYKPQYLEKLFDCYPNKKVYLFLYTAKKAMLEEIKFENGQISLNPVPIALNKQLPVQLISSPGDFFNPYSPEFSEFLKGSSNIPLSEFKLDVLAKLASEEESQKNYVKASMYYEAILQLEPYPEHRFEQYKRLAVCYFKSGNASLAKRINEKIYKMTESNPINLIPERGF